MLMIYLETIYGELDVLRIVISFYLETTNNILDDLRAVASHFLLQCCHIEALFGRCFWKWF